MCAKITTMTIIICACCDHTPTYHISDNYDRNSIVMKILTEHFRVNGINFVLNLRTQVESMLMQPRA